MQKTQPSNVLFYPEGTRMQHLTLASVDDAIATLKPGLLWLIYSKQQYPVQVLVSSNKERALNECAWSIRLGVTIHTYVGRVLHPRDIESFDGFMHAIASQWHEAWNAVYPPQDYREDQTPKSSI